MPAEPARLSLAMSDPPACPSATGAAAIEAALATMPFNPGVYRMLDAKGDALYVGKARSLKKRVAVLYPDRPAGRTAAADGVRDRRRWR